MLEGHQTNLEKMGLSATEAQIYLTLLRKGGRIGASEVAAATGMARSSVYLAVNRLTDLGLVEAEAGYGSGFSAVPPKRALPHLIDRGTEELSERKRLAGELVAQLGSLAEPAETDGDAEVIQVIRDPRVIADRFDQLQLEAEHQIDVISKAPVFCRPSNPEQDKVQRRGVRCRSLYEQAILNDPAVEPYLTKWIAAGEEARVFEGELPHKLAIFDRQSILMPLVTPSGNGRTLFIRHPQLAMTLSIAFDSLWERAKPIPVELATPAKQERSRGRNGRRDSTERNRTATAS